MKKLKDYAHLYLGAKIRMWNDVIKDWSSWRKMSIQDLNLIINHDAKIEIQLRPLTDMSQEEGKQIIQSIYYSIYNNEATLKDIGKFEKNDSNDSVGFVAYEEQYRDRLSLTIDTERGIEFFVSGGEMILRQFDITKYLLSRHFDLFSLIEAGLAVDKSKQLKISLTQK